MSKKVDLKEWYKKIGEKGGKSKSKRKTQASRKNLEKALSKRWKKKIRLFDKEKVK